MFICNVDCTYVKIPWAWALAWAWLISSLFLLWTCMLALLRRAVRSLFLKNKCISVLVQQIFIKLFIYLAKLMMQGNFTISKSEGSNSWVLLVFTKLCLFIIANTASKWNDGALLNILIVPPCKGDQCFSMSSSVV